MFQKLKSKKISFEDNSQMRSEFDQLRSKKSFRTVKLVYKSCCGCGCSDITITRDVPVDSPLRDGDRAKKLEDTDQML